ncbi:hypothetical protein BKA70DRAFT_1220374 [Coprinopsis sp. MPI-PUGE-AT-0042]|nr:hypothetical protein BKA70DRAFT_1220374 [Coprinopsis sp. MPI-PUGE-AT-0042]
MCRHIHLFADAQRRLRSSKTPGEVLFGTDYVDANLSLDLNRWLLQIGTQLILSEKQSSGRVLNVEVYVHISGKSSLLLDTDEGRRELYNLIKAQMNGVWGDEPYINVTFRSSGVPGTRKPLPEDLKIWQGSYMSTAQCLKLLPLSKGDPEHIRGHVWGEWKEVFEVILRNGALGAGVGQERRLTLWARRTREEEGWHVRGIQVVQAPACAVPLNRETQNTKRYQGCAEPKSGV